MKLSMKFFVTFRSFPSKTSAKSMIARMMTKFFATFCGAAFLGSIQQVDAQWQTQTFQVKPGWTAVYLHVDPSYTNLDYLVGSDPNNPISEI
jgi:hypothetical protein